MCWIGWIAVIFSSVLIEVLKNNVPQKVKIYYLLKETTTLICAIILDRDIMLL